MAGKNRYHIKLQCPSRITQAEAWLLTCESWMNCGEGRVPMWDGHTILRVMREIKHVHGYLVTSHTSQYNLTRMWDGAVAEPDRRQFTSEQLQELLISAMNMGDSGYLYTRSRLGLEAAIRAREGK